MQFSDRYNGDQNFNISATELTWLWLDQGGRLWIYNNHYFYYILNGNDMSCTGNLISSYVPGLGNVTVQIGPWQVPTQSIASARQSSLSQISRGPYQLSPASRPGASQPVVT